VQPNKAGCTQAQALVPPVMATLLPTVLLAVLSLLAVRATPSPRPPAGVIVPPWDMVIEHGDNAFCVNTSAAAPGNSRWTWLALPHGPAPRTGWPVYIAFTPWIRAPTPDQRRGRTCHLPGGGGQHHPPTVWSCMDLLKAHCAAAPRHGAGANVSACLACASGVARDEPAAYARANCSAAQHSLWCRYRGHVPMPAWERHKNFPVFELPFQVPRGCFGFGNSSGSNSSAYTPQTCGYDAVSGMMWSQRLNQLLLANGIGASVRAALLRSRLRSFGSCA
jgi:hypothetical protein